MRTRYTFSLLLATLILSFSLAATSAQTDSSSLHLFQSAVNAAKSVLKVTKTGAGEGQVVSNIAGINCGIDCSGTYPTNTEVRLEATATKGSFDSWGGACTGTTPTCTVKVAGIKEVTANFSEKTLVKEYGKWWGLHNGGRPTFYYRHLMKHYPPTFTVVMAGCEKVIVQNNGHRFVTDNLIVKQSDVGGRGMALTTQLNQCSLSRLSYIEYFKEDMPVQNPPIFAY